MYCISCYFREGFIFANFASQTLAKISTSIHVYLCSNDNIRKIAKLTTRELPQKSKNAEITVRENNGLYSMSRMTEYIAIEDDNVISHFLQVLVGWQTAVNAVIDNSERVSALLLRMTYWNCV